MKTARPPKRRRGAALSWVLCLSVIAAAMAILSPTAALLLLGGLVPGYVAILTDTNKRQTLAMAVIATNSAGLIPFCLELSHARHPFTTLATMIATPWIWLVVYLAASLGWLIHFAIPPVVLVIMDWSLSQKQAALETDRDQLKREWGDILDTPEKEI